MSEPSIEELKAAELQQRFRAEHAEHVIVEVLGISHEDLDGCGCSSCEFTRANLIATGILRPRD